MEATLTHQVMDERRECGEPHARARSPRRAGAGRRARAHDMRVNGPPKSGPSLGAGARHAREWSAKIRPLALRGRGYLLPFDFLVSWLLRLS
jgi:hypothetical protein